MRNKNFNGPRLKSKKDIEALFREGKAFSVFPLRAIYKESNTSGKASTQVGFAVPKKTIKLSVKRNKVRRRMRAAWQQTLKAQQHSINGLQVFFLFTGSYEQAIYHNIQEAMNSLVMKLAAKSPVP